MEIACEWCKLDADSRSVECTGGCKLEIDLQLASEIIDAQGRVIQENNNDMQELLKQSNDVLQSLVDMGKTGESLESVRQKARQVLKNQVIIDLHKPPAKPH